MFAEKRFESNEEVCAGTEAIDESLYKKVIEMLKNVYIAYEENCVDK